ncbi:tetratricopeptide repeat-containing sulfotransferase family protein [Amylibacter sp. IMCC11727]|uniref:tetratricopeptide repeat-containing sulfotransferase family protein n=1 Tax=Amylibacter sp. IMCC11727 TaxID=3039851 RepID=UPI00244E1339|nr:tetratricopeptide repeat-containing sulfotransferase family protein [Amylibacter sp. IMCC11727]WGI20296.1 tetratricopeptide repeat protein [Amylibacter sp. IMCC11727]
MAGIKQVLDLAEAAAKAGDTGRAIGLYRQILTKVPKHSKAKKALARLEKQGGGSGQMTQNDAQALIQILNSGNFPAAQSAAKQLSERFPNEPFVFNILGYASGMVGDEKAAVAAFKWAIKLNPNFVEALSNYGSYLVQIGKPKEAVEVLRKAIAKKPNYAEAHHNLGLALTALENAQDGMVHLDKAIALQPNYGNAFNSRGNVFKNIGQLSKAVEDFRAALKINPQDSGAKENLSNVYASLGDVTESLKLTDELLATDPNNLDWLRRRAIQLHALGRKDEAVTAFRAVLEKSETDAEAIAISLELVAPEDRVALRDRATHLAQDDSVDPHDKVRLAFALASDAERTKQFDVSQKWLTTANAQYKDILPPLPEEEAVKFEQARKFFGKGIPDKFKSAGLDTDRPIFIVGLMRSGTSLAEQIISSHSKVFGAGELNSVRDLGGPILAAQDTATPSQITAFAQDYLSVLDLADPQKRRAVDKMPANFLYVGLIKTAFPNAKIINTVRDPRDTCFSIWKNFFDTYAHQYAYDQKELAAFANSYKSLMNFWDEQFPGDIYHLRYEDLIANQEGESRKLLDYLGLEWEDEVLEFHKSKRAVRTASVNQVREKIYNTSVKSWTHYVDHLQDLFDGLDADLWAHAMVD